MPPEHLGAAFTVIQLSPPPAQDERVNVGVIAADEGRAAIRLLTSWRRAQHFSGGDLAGVRDVLERLQERISASTRDGFTLEDLHRLVSRDRGVIQFAPLRESRSPWSRWLPMRPPCIWSTTDGQTRSFAGAER